MQKLIESIYEWNDIVNNTNYIKSNEADMLTEEFSEYILALKNKDIKELIDAYCDMIIVMTWTMFKLWVESSDLEKAMLNIMQSNYSKFILENWEFKCIRNEQGKIIKPLTYKEPDLNFISEKYWNKNIFISWKPNIWN